MRFPARFIFASVALALLLSLAACDGDDDDTSGVTPTAVAPTAGVPTDPCTLRTSLEGQPLGTGPSAAFADLRWQLCIGGAAAGSSEKFLFQSDDAGVSWTLISRTTLGNPTPEAGVGELPNGNAAQAILFRDADNGWLGLSSPGMNLFRSMDGGVSWTAVDVLPPGLPVTAIEFSDATNGTLTTPDGDWTTADGGATWTVAP
jgi:hypothetical protein